MAEQLPTDRLKYDGDLAPVVQRICDAYGVGTSTNHSVIDMGYEDCNVIIDTEQDRFMAKMFAKTRTPDDISRYAGIMQKVIEAGVHHPELISTVNGEMVYMDSGITLVLMRFVEGKTFFELGRIPDDDERKAILEQAVKINAIDYEPPYLFDSWAIPNIKTVLERVQQYIEPDDLELVLSVIEQYEAIPGDELPHCFVHGDIIKTNLVKADDGGIYVLDFSVANRYPRIQDLAVIAANLLHDENGSSLKERCEQIAEEYSQLNPLTAQEREHLYAYALAGVAMEFMGSHQEKYINGNDSEETDYWFNLGREGLRRALN
jgi:Ser/Thr protein kinase RdoA (MazF antagonist)